MNRRKLLGILGGAAVAPILSPLSPEKRFDLGRALHARLTHHEFRALDPHQAATVTRIAEMIIPETDTPGATSVRVNQFIDLLLSEWYSDKDRDRFIGGLGAIDARSQQRHTAAFIDLAEADQVEMLKSLDAKKGEEGSAEDAFATLKGLTIYGYFTSEVVMKEVIHYQVIPGRFEGCVPI